jgi:hypothetical protein
VNPYPGGPKHADPDPQHQKKFHRALRMQYYVPCDETAGFLKALLLLDNILIKHLVFVVTFGAL